jgi:hypothetical protein
MAKYKYRRLQVDPQLYAGEHGELISAHVDDVLITGPQPQYDQVFENLAKEFKLKKGPTLDSTWQKYLGHQMRRVTYNDGSEVIEVKPPTGYLTDLVDELGLQRAKTVATPAATSTGSEESAVELSELQHALFRKICGKLVWIIQERPDIAQAVNQLSRACARPTEADYERMKRLVKYISGTVDLRLQLRVDKSPPDLLCLTTDASWASAPGRKSTSGIVMTYRGMLFGAWSRTQKVLAHSSCESELLAMSDGVNEAKFLRTVLRELGKDVSIELSTDSKAAISFSLKRGVVRMKHLELRQLQIQEDVRQHVVLMKFVGSDSNLADPLTKPSTAEKHTWFLRRLGLCYGDGNPETVALTHAASSHS